MNPTSNIAANALKCGGKIINYGFNPDNNEENWENIDKKEYIKIVTSKAEKEIVSIIKKSHPDHHIINNNNKILSKKENSEYQWIITSITEPENFTRGIANFACTIVIKNKNKVYSEVVYNPITQELYVATEGEGARYNNYRIRPNKKKNNSKQRLSLYISGSKKDNNCLEKLSNLVDLNNTKFVSSGCEVIDMMHLAQNKIDMMIKSASSNSEHAGMLIARESGSIKSIKDGYIIISNKQII